MSIQPEMIATESSNGTIIYTYNKQEYTSTIKNLVLQEIFYNINIISDKLVDVERIQKFRIIEIGVITRTSLLLKEEVRRYGNVTEA